MEPLTYAVYVVIKYLAYAAWCYAGIRWFQAANGRGNSAFGLGFLRLLLGAGFGLGIFVVGAFMHLSTPQNPLLVYFAVYAPVRLVEWAIMVLLLRTPPSTTLTRKALWILGGIVVSHAADIPLFLMTGTSPRDMLPVGRFLC
jgi:hypothetical protein